MLFTLTGFLNPAFAEAGSRILFNEMPSRLPSLPELVNMYYFGQLDEGDFQSLSKQNGFDWKYAKGLFETSRNLLTPIDAVSAWRRGIINEDNLNNILRMSRYTPEDIGIVKRVTEYFPTPTDLVRFAVREVYSSEITQRFGQKEDLPPEFIREAQKAGLGQEQATNYWAAHWELPSIGQGFEMLHRGVISESDLNMLLRALDVMPFWREKLTQISYTPLTRVDVRRMYRLGVIDEEGVKKAYKDIGYNDANADLMVSFTKRYETEEDTNLSRQTVVDAYKKDIINVDDLNLYLSELGYSEDSVSLIITIADYQKYEEYLDLLVEDILARYRLGDITIADARTLMNQLDLPDTFVNSTINKELAKTANKTKIPSKADVERWLKLNVINENEYSVYMEKQGYSKIDISRYLEEINKETDTSKRKYMSITVYNRWYLNNIITENIYRSTLTEMGYNNTDIEKSVKEIKQQKEAIKE